MLLIQILRKDPLAGVAICLCLITILWCIRLLHRMKARSDRFLVGLVGVIASYQGLRILKDAGVWNGWKMESFAALMVTVAYLAVVVILRFNSSELVRTRIQLRLAEANEPPPPAPPDSAAKAGEPAVQASRPAG